MNTKYAIRTYGYSCIRTSHSDDNPAPISRDSALNIRYGYYSVPCT